MIVAYSECVCVCMCVFVDLAIQYAIRTRHTAIFGMSGSTVLFHIIS